MATVTKEVSVEQIIQTTGLSETKASALVRWIIATRTKRLVRTAASAEALQEATHNVKLAFSDHDEMMKAQRWAREFYQL